MPDIDALFLVGKVVGTHGIRGQLSIFAFSGETTALLAVDSVILKGREDSGERFAVAKASLHGKKIILTLEGFGNINEVLPLVGRDVFLRREQLPPLAEDEYYWSDLVGLEVITDSGTRLGHVAEILETGSNDVYVVQGDEKEFLIPATDEVVTQIDLERRLMVVTPLEGLLDL